MKKNNRKRESKYIRKGNEFTENVDLTFFFSLLLCLQFYSFS